MAVLTVPIKIKYKSVLNIFGKNIKPRRSSLCLDIKYERGAPQENVLFHGQLIRVSDNNDANEPNLIILLFCSLFILFLC